MEPKRRKVVKNASVLSEVFQLNIQGINPTVDKQKIKFKTLSEFVQTSEKEIPFFVVIETHLKQYILDAEVSIPDYNIVRADRINRRNGGVAIYSHHTFSLENTRTFSNSYCESAIAYNKENEIVVAAVYRPPGCPPKKFEECLKQIKSFKEEYENAEILVFGDMNLKFIDWETETMKRPENIQQCWTSDEKISSNMLLDFMNENLLIQMVHENTRKGKSILDLVFTSDDDLIFDVQVEKNQLDTDHDTVTCQLMHRVGPNEESIRNRILETEKKSFDRLNFEKAEWKKIKEELSVLKWKEVLKEEMSVETMIKVFEDKILTCSAKYTPERKQPDKKCKISRNRLKLIRKRKKLKSSLNYIKYVKPEKTQQSALKQEKLEKKIMKIESDIKSLIAEELHIKELRAVEKMKTNPKLFYKYVKKSQKVESKIGPLQDEQGNLNSDPEIKANLLQKQYIKVFSKPENAKPENEYPDKCDSEISDVTITIEDVKEAIKEIPTNAAPGPDKLPAIVLKECADEIAEAIVMIWTKSLETSEIPDIMKLQTIIPLFKKGRKSLPENYRPVSLTSHLIKLIGRVFRKKIIKHIEDNNLLSDNQHAFRIGRSCLTQLLHHIDEVLKSLENKMNVDVVYLDFAKAFDKVDHKILLKKLEQFGIRGKLLKWIESFISNRYQQVLVDGKLSNKEKVISGVPQGTVLGPLLFLIFINDLEDALKYSILRIFADDSKIVKEIQDEDDHNKLQEDLNTAITWATNNNMELNQSKFQLLQYGKEELKQPYAANSETITKEEVVKDLGVQLAEDLSWEAQISEAVKQGRKFTGWILRSFFSRNPEVIISLFRTYVIPRLEYASILWSPYKLAEINQLEAVQRSITAKVDGMKNLNYHQRLHSLKLYSMMRRRERYLAIHMFKLATGMVPNNSQLEFYNTSRHGMKCRKPKLKASMVHLSTVRLHFFTSTGPAIYNILPAEVKQAKSLQQFKSRLDRFLMRFPDLPPTPGYPKINNNSILEWASGSNDYVEIINTLAGSTRQSQREEPRCDPAGS